MSLLEDPRPVYVTAPLPIVFHGENQGTKSSFRQTLFSMEVLIKTLTRIPCSGIGLGLLSGVFFATAGFIVKLIPVNPIEIVISRYDYLELQFDHSIINLITTH